MDKVMAQRVDALVEEEIVKGYRIKSLDPALVTALQQAHDTEPSVQVFDRVRFTKLTPRKKRLIAEEVVRRYHVDLQNPGILSSAKLRQINMERGEWTAGEEKRIKELEILTNNLMHELYKKGFDNRHKWNEEYVNLVRSVQEGFANPNNEDGQAVVSPDSQKQVDEMLTRWLSTTKGDEADFRFLMQSAPRLALMDDLQSLEDLRVKLQEYSDCIDLRKELMILQVKQGKMLSESVEQRRDVTEEMARLYFCCEVVDDRDIPKGPLSPKIEGLWDLPDEVIQWLLVEVFFFFEGTPDVEGARDFLEQWGFIAVTRSISKDASKAASDESPEALSSNTDTLVVAPMPVSSSE